MQNESFYQALHRSRVIKRKGLKAYAASIIKRILLHKRCNVILSPLDLIHSWNLESRTQ